MGKGIIGTISTTYAALRRLAADRRGNILAMSAAALVPLMAMIGGAIDLSRLYMTNTRLQQACDAGALAARRTMADVNVLSNSEKAIAANYFSFNFPNNTYSAGTPTVAYARGAVGTVAGAASLAVPMTIMKMFGYSTITLNVTCQSTLVVPNTDVMFVLDVTGSMNDTPSGDTQPKIAGLKQAVKDFYGALGPGTAAGAGRVRYGFMPYSSNVNVGKIVYGLNRGSIVGGTGAENANYRSRIAQTTTEHVPSYGTESNKNQTSSNSTTPTYGSFFNDAVYYNQTLAQCTARVAPDTDTVSSSNTTLSSDENPPAYPNTVRNRTYTTVDQHAAVDNGASWTQTSGSGTTAKGTCQLRHRNGTYTTTTASSTTTPTTWTDREKFVSWNYVLRSIDVSQIVQNGAGANPTYFTGYAPDTTPNVNMGYAWDALGNYYTYSTPTPSTVTWNGCIEEASTDSSIGATSSLDIPSGANDLKIDLIPSDTSTRWKPYLPGIQFDSNGYWLGRDAGWISSGFAACPREAAPLAQYQSDYVATTKSSGTFNTYVDSLSAVGGTYHDIGMIWGARFLSQSGIFQATNNDSTGPGGFQISRHIVFMTDGTLDTRGGANDPWGVNQLEGRIAPTGTSDTDLNNIHRRRMNMICNAMKGKGFTIWVIGFGISTMPQELQDCASDANHWSLASSSAALRTRFQQIAQTIGGLRLSQ